jgi:hypothetical protein
MQTLEEPITEQTEEADGFHITSDAAANWLLRKLANIEAEQRRVQAQAAQIVKQLESDAARLRYLYEAELEAYVRERLQAEGNRRRSVTFLQGTCAFRIVPGGVRITDPLAALDYASRCLPEAVKTQQVLDTARYRQVVEETGELLPGVEVTPAQEAFRVTFGKREE